VDSLKALDLKRPIREADIALMRDNVRVQPGAYTKNPCVIDPCKIRVDLFVSSYTKNI
jgi:hypothetical protein